MMHNCKMGLKYLITFFLIVAVAVALLVLSAFIPRKTIKNNIYESAVYLCDGELFEQKVSGVEGSKIDRYADSILLGIAYQYDSNKPFKSVMQSAYYYTEYANENENLYNAVTYNLDGNNIYLRYWHGSTVIVRLLHVLFNIRQIYIINGVLLAGLAAVLIVILIRYGYKLSAIALGAGLIFTSSWFVPMSLEYTWTYYIMLIASIIGVVRTHNNKLNNIGLFFMVTGMITSYMDFLTTETITLLVPLLLIIYIEVTRNGKADIKRIVKAVIFWIIGYLGMWLMKWGIAAIVLKENVMPYITEHISERLGGNVGVPTWAFYTGAITRNIKHLFPWEYGVWGIVAGITVILTIAYICYVYKCKKINSGNVVMYAILAVIPYIRYIVLHNHSYLHSFFTYRAQMATIIAIVFVVGEVATIKHKK